MIKLDAAALDALPSRYRANLINGITGYKPALLVGTASAQGASNLAVFSNVFHVGASPPVLGLIVRPRPEGTERHTLDNILSTGAFTLNHITDRLLPRAHQTSARYPRDQSEFSATGLTEEWLEGFAAPFVHEAPVQLGMGLIEHRELAINNTHLVLAALRVLRCPSAAVREDGSVDLAALGTQAICGLDSYHSPGQGIRFSYAKADKPVQRLD